MNINNDNLSDKEKFLDTNTKSVLKQNQWTLDDLKNDINSVDKSPYSSTGSLVLPPSLNNQDELLIGNDNSISGIRSNISSSKRRGSFVLSDSESNHSSTLSTQSNTRRRALSTTSRPKDRFSMLEFGSSRIDDTGKLFSPTRHSMAFDNGFNINNRVLRNSLEDREWTIDRERIGNAGKGFGNLINDEGGKGQKNRIHNTETDIEKIIAQKDGSIPSETTLTNSKMCKQFLENKYHVLFKIINNNEVYNPLTIVKNRKKDMTCEESDYNLGSSEKFNGGNSNRIISNRTKSRGSLPRRKSSIWDVSHMEIIKDYEQRNKFVNNYGFNENFNNKDPIFKVESESDEIKKRQKQLHLSQMFNPEIQIMSPLEEREEEGSSGGKLKREKTSKSLSSNSIKSTLQGKEDSNSKPKKWSIHLFKRKDKKHKNESISSDVGTIQVPDHFLGSHTNAKNMSESSSGDQTPRSSLEDSTRQIIPEDIAHNNERMHYESGSKYEKYVQRVPEEKNRAPVDDRMDRYNSLDTSIDHSNNSSTRNSVDLGSDVAVDDQVVYYLSRRNTAESLNIEDNYDRFKFLGYEQNEGNRTNHLLNENKPESSESEEEYEDENVNGLVGETVSVNLDILPQELIDLVLVYQEQGIVDRNVDNGHYAELDVGLNENFKFHKLISYGDVDEIIKGCDELIEEATKLLEANEIFLAERKDIIENNNYVSNKSYIFESLVMNLPNTSTSSFSIDQQSIIAEYKLNIEEGIKLLNNKLINIEDIVNKLEEQHVSFTEEMETTLNKIEKMTLDVNNDYFHDLKILEDEIHLLIAEREKLPWLDVFYLMMSYVITAIMIMYWFIVACFKLFKKILLVPCRMVKIFSSLNSSINA
ncbi:hypothetical protein C1645_764207 [Glomus cerebriforme]|uniref:Uncharacterized protein n=1 Tax=Glomus cerebriforme TaxID=658196 RepID=A0A397TCX9_9GLOM|nr:hypothetical protein C1645_764207 [Glomus cerebriforme]